MESVLGEDFALDAHGGFSLSTIGYCLHSGAGHCVLGVVCVSVDRRLGKALAGKPAVAPMLCQRGLHCVGGSYTAQILVFLA